MSQDPYTGGKAWVDIWTKIKCGSPYSDIQQLYPDIAEKYGTTIKNIICKYVEEARDKWYTNKSYQMMVDTLVKDQDDMTIDWFSLQRDVDPEDVAEYLRAKYDTKIMVHQLRTTSKIPYVDIAVDKAATQNKVVVFTEEMPDAKAISNMLIKWRTTIVHNKMEWYTLHM